MKYKVSIIIPAYNAEKTLKRCLDSVFAQEFDSFEVILVNDGSTDTTLEIAKYYKGHSNFILIDQPNAGVARARWEGINASRGEYISFVDSDDYIAKNMLIKMHSQAKTDNADIVISNWFRVEKCKIVPCKYYDYYHSTFYPREAISRIIFRHQNAALWNKLWRKSLFINSNLEETFHLQYGEDLLFCLIIFEKARTFSFVSEELYFYVLNCDSVTQNLSKETIADSISVLEKLKLYLLKKSDDNFLSQGYFYYFSKLLNRYQQLCMLTKQDPQIDTLKKDILKKCNNVPLKFLLRSLSGPKDLSKILLVKSGLFPCFYSVWLNFFRTSQKSKQNTK